MSLLNMVPEPSEPPLPTSYTKPLILLRYLVGIRSKATKTITLRDAPFHIVRRDVKRLKMLTPIASTQAVERASQRSKLGEAFGTKKAIKAIKSKERNQVDVASMEGVLGIIGEGVEGRTAGLPTEGQSSPWISSRLI